MTTQAQDKKNYKTTLNLPQTAFAMEAKLTTNEPLRLQRWQEMHLYKKIMVARSGGKKWILHDGPPFANGDIHIGHVINKTLKDIILRFRSMQGYMTPYVPGWDCHGLPIEHKIQQELGPKLRQMDVVDVRKRCYAYAEKYATIQTQQFQRLGILAEWDHPYLTMKPTYEAQTLEVFARFVEAGLVYKQLKPVHWSIANQTALADAELEYKDVDDTSVYVEFECRNPGIIKSLIGSESIATVHFLVWTTTPWTLPANLAIAVQPAVSYAVVRYTREGREKLGIVAAELMEKVFTRPGIDSFEIVGAVEGARLAEGDIEYSHPFIDRYGKILPAQYVTTTDGTGLVHIAPGHGEEDYATGIANGLDIYCPVLANGRFDASVPQWLQGKTVWEANPLVVEELKRRGELLAAETIRHSYPHDWRSKTPTIFRATEQWFVGIDRPFIRRDEPDAPRSIRQRALDTVMQGIEFIPAWGKSRMIGMLESRPDWCISRQRAWGLPIPVFYNEKGEALLTPQSVRAVARHVMEKGSDVWFTEPAKELLGADFVYPAGFSGETLRKEKDIFDVWFESGSSWHAVLQGRSYLHFPADLYLEGSDQHRGWFQLSLLPSLGATGQAPFKQVLTHGFVVKPDGRKVSKSDPEYVTATQEISKHGADLLRLWCSSIDYEGDIPTSPRAIQEFGDKYRKIRNTLRFLLSNLYDFNPHTDTQLVTAGSLDGWISAEMDQLIAGVLEMYESYQIHKAFRLLHEFCAVQLSSVYGNAMKDRLYCDLPNSPLRRRSQTVMYRMATALTKLLAPMIVFTADEAWEYILHKSHDEANLPSVHVALLPKPLNAPASEHDRRDWQLLMDLRGQATAQLDKLKKAVGLNKASDAELVYKVDNEALRRKLQAYGPDLEDVAGAGFHSFAEDATPGSAVEVTVIDRRETYAACARCWKRRSDVGSDKDYPDLCARDAAAVKSLSQGK